MIKIKALYKSEGRDFSLDFFNREEELKADLDEEFDIGKINDFLRDCIESSILTFENFQKCCKEAEELFQCDICIDEEVKRAWKGVDGTRLFDLKEEMEAKEKNGGILPSNFRTTSQKCNEAIDTYIASFGEEANIGANYDYSEGYNILSKAYSHDEFTKLVKYNSYDNYCFLNEDEAIMEDFEEDFTKLDDYDEDDYDEDECDGEEESDDEEDFHLDFLLDLIVEQ